MRYVFGISIFFCLLIAPSAQAFDAQQINPFVYSECKTALTDNCRQISPLLKRTLEMCEINSSTHRCDELAKKNPDLKDLILKCDPLEFCRQQTPSMSAEALSCWKGLKGSVVDQVSGLRDLVVGAWENAKTKKSQSKAFFEACEKSLECKRQLIKDTPYFANMNDERLEKFAATRLYTEAERRRPLGQKREFNPITGEKEVETKLSDLWNMTGTLVADKYHEYSCYTPEAKEELKCYMFASIIDPTMVAGGGLKLLRAQKILKVSQALSKEQFTTRYLRYSPTQPTQNRSWMNLATSSVPQKNLKFFDVENAVMKNLNDTLDNKNLVTSLTNYHKEILHTKTEALLGSLKANYPDLEMISYSDFKSSRFAFKGQGPPDLEKRLNQILQDTNQEFSEYLTSNKYISATDQPETWFRAGYGETADQATLASRYSRQNSENNLQSFNSTSLRADLNKKVLATEKLRSDLQNELARTSVVEGGATKTLSADAIDILRKNGEDLAKARLDLKKRFGLEELAPSTVQKMKSYVTAVDEFSPGIHIEARQVASLGEATYGGIAADMAGMGAKNLQGTARALSESRSLDEVLEKTRQAEKTVTEAFVQQRQDFQDILKDVVGADRIKTICSGDDCVALPKQALSTPEKQQILQKLTDSGYSSQFRLAFVPDNVPEAKIRSQLGVHGELIEKNLRKNLADKMEPNKMKGIIFGVDMRTTQLNQGQVTLMTATNPEVRLTTSEQKLIQESFKKALEQLNYHP